jgi:hypothetical protein
MGKREAIVRLLAAMVRLRNRLRRNPPATLKSVPNLRLHCRNDQFLWQAYYLYPALSDEVGIELDSGFQCFANIACGDWALQDNKDFDFTNEGLIAKSSGGRPGILHFSSASTVMKPWARRLGLLESSRA